MPEQKVKAADNDKTEKSSRIGNLLWYLFSGSYAAGLITMGIIIIYLFSCIAIDIFNRTILSIGWTGLAEATLSLTGFFIGIRFLWLWRGVHAEKRKINFRHIRCFWGHHDYKSAGGFEEHIGPYIYNTYISRCSRCSSKREETYDDKSNFY